MSPMSAHFLRLCGKEYMRTHLGAVLDSITELSRTSSSPAWTIHIIIQFSALVPSHQVHATPADANAQAYTVWRQAQEAGDPEVLVTAESVATLNLSSSEQVPKKILPLALKCASSPVPVEGGAEDVELTLVGPVGCVGVVVDALGWHWE